MNAARDARKMAETLEGLALILDHQGSEPDQIVAKQLRDVARGLDDMRADLERAAHNTEAVRRFQPEGVRESLLRQAVELLSDVDNRTGGTHGNPL